jgi:hypothetical protein
MNKYFFFFVIGLFTTQSFSQEWVQTSATPVGGGVTDLLVRNNGDVLATVGSFNWPSVAGGVRKSTDGGQTWQNVASAFNGRTIEEAFDGNLYASIWFYPQNEGLYRSTNGGDTWAGPIYSVPSGNNIFSIAVKPGSSNYSIFAGTRNGVMRSTDSGTSFQSVNNGIPANSWVRDLEIDSSGIIAAATTNGLFISTNNGDLWEQATGIDPSDTAITLLFDDDNFDGASDPSLYIGSEKAYIYDSFKSSKYLLATLLRIFGDGHISSIFGFFLSEERKKMITISVYPDATTGGGVFISTDFGQTFTEENDGLPQNPQVSAISGRIDTNGDAEQVVLYAGFYENSSSGAKIYTRSFIVGIEKTDLGIPEKFNLYQNYPNPFNPSTTIQFSIPEQTFVKLEVFNTLGEKVTTLVSEELRAGNYKYEWNAERLPSGIYLYRISTNRFSEMKKMILLK